MISESLEQKQSDFTRILNLGIDKFKPKYLLVGFTGGSDSLTILHLMIKSGLPFRPFFCNTGIGIKEQWQFVRDYSNKVGLELIEQTPVYKTYKQMILTNGFPGASSHLIMYSNLISFVENLKGLDAKLQYYKLYKAAVKSCQISQ